MDVHRDFWTRLFKNFWKVPALIDTWRELWAPVNQCWEELSATLKPLVDGADLLFTGVVFEGPAANVAEHYDIPLATLHYNPTRANGQFMPFLPPPVARFVSELGDWFLWRMAKKVDDAQRRDLGLPASTKPPPQRIADRGSLEIQAYDEVFVPGLAAEWAQFADRRPFVGALTLELTVDADEDVSSWIAAGSPPIYFGFGSMAVGSATDTIAMIAAACAELGERALVVAGSSDFSGVPNMENVKVVSAVNFATVFPACRAVVHHGGAGTTAAGLRAGVPTLVLWTWPEQSLWGRQLKRLKVGTARRFSTTTKESLVADLRTILAPEYAARARQVAPRMTKPSDSVATAADLMENFARLGRVG
jgi:UDP:flavonoid glycosyltransferase YjiC (YdhE family)